MKYIVVFRPEVRIVGPPGDGRLAELLNQLVAAGRNPSAEDRIQALMGLQDSLVVAGVQEDQLFEVSQLILRALHPQDFRNHVVLPEKYELEVGDEIPVA